PVSVLSRATCCLRVCKSHPTRIMRSASLCVTSWYSARPRLPATSGCSHDISERMNLREMSGLEGFQAMRAGTLPHPTMADTIPMRVTEASPGYVKFHARADRRHVNPLGGVHGGLAATVLDPGPGGGS